MSDLLVYTDLDGTLLDHHTYSFANALPALARLKAKNIPLIINSSKTAAEIEALRYELDIRHPYIVENGSAVCLPPGCGFVAADGATEIHTFGAGYTEILAALRRLRSEHAYKFQGFADMSVKELCTVTGLNEQDAALARQRHASEPLRWQDTATALARFSNDLAHHRLRLLQGGRFYHVMGPADKVTAMDWLTGRYRAREPERDWTTVALGDGENDRAMLEAADIAVVMPAATGGALVLQRTDGVIYSRQDGPGGWNEAINAILDDNLNHGD